MTSESWPKASTVQRALAGASTSVGEDRKIPERQLQPLLFTGPKSRRGPRAPHGARPSRASRRPLAVVSITRYVRPAGRGGHDRGAVDVRQLLALRFATRTCAAGGACMAIDQAEQSRDGRKSRPARCGAAAMAADRSYWQQNPYRSRGPRCTRPPIGTSWSDPGADLCLGLYRLRL